MRKPLIAGNWKMNGTTEFATDLATAVAQGANDTPADVLVCPPHGLIAPVVHAVKNSSVAVGGQDCSPHESGAYTGDTSPALLADLGCGYAIVGHSERRVGHGETDAVVQSKAQSATAHGLIAVVCIGETEDEQQSGQTETVLKTQTLGSVPDNATADTVVIAYEPVWAIGTGKTPTADDVQRTHAFIRGVVADKWGADVANGMRILYGGSVKPTNANELLALPDVDGALVGGASLNADDFVGIVGAV